MCYAWPGPRCSNHTYKNLRGTVAKMDSYLDDTTAIRRGRISYLPDTMSDNDQKVMRNWERVLRNCQSEYFGSPDGIKSLHEWAEQNKDQHPEVAAEAQRLAKEYSDRRQAQLNAYRSGLTADMSADTRTEVDSFIGEVDISSNLSHTTLMQVTDHVLSQKDRVEQVEKTAKAESGYNNDYSDAETYFASNLSAPVKERMQMAVASTQGDIKRYHSMMDDAYYRATATPANVRSSTIESRINEKIDSISDRYHETRRVARRQEMMRKVEGLSSVVDKITPKHGMTDELRTEWDLRLAELRAACNQAKDVPSSREEKTKVDNALHKAADILKVIQHQMK